MQLPKSKPHQIKQHMWIFVNCLIENPSFDSQTKENMTKTAGKFGSKFKLQEEFAKKSQSSSPLKTNLLMYCIVIKTGVVDNILTFAKFKQDQDLKKTDGKKRQRCASQYTLQ